MSALIYKYYEANPIVDPFCLPFLMLKLNELFIDSLRVDATKSNQIINKITVFYDKLKTVFDFLTNITF